jgi:hypothetical protein
MSWINNTFSPNGAAPWQQLGIGSEIGPLGTNYDGGPMPGPYGGAGDGFRPTWWGGGSSGSSAASSTTNGLLGQILGLLQQLTGSISGSGSSSAYGSSPYGEPSPMAMPAPEPEPPGATFANATLSSTGDPHLAVTGTLQGPNGTTTQINDRYDSMASQRDLLSTNDFGDHLRVATTATTPNANGVTYNASATATMNHGRDSVSMGPGGVVSVTSNGSAVALGAGQSTTLSGGEVVSESAGGAVTIREQNARGESLTTTFTNNGSGVDVNATASGGVTLGGALVRHAVNGVG